MSETDCVFCRIITGEEPAQFIDRWPDAVAIRPLNPVTTGHTLVIPKAHVPDFVADPVVTGAVMARAAELAANLGVFPANLITSAGREATQSVFHLHIHLVPRKENDGLKLPWSKATVADFAMNAPIVHVQEPVTRIVPVPVLPENWIRR